MSRPLFFILFLLLGNLSAGLTLAATVPTPIAVENPGIYLLRQGDSVMISVWREDALQKQVIVLPDGSITFPLVGRIEVAGLSTPEVERRITAKLKEYIPEPVVTVVIAGIDGNRAYVMGKVNSPGSLIINGPLTVLQAISIMGGFDKFADESGIKVIRAKADRQEVFPVHYKDIISGRDMSSNILLKAGDTIIVP
jgi:polysaccharide export outer membrane protein